MAHHHLALRLLCLAYALAATEAGLWCDPANKTIEKVRAGAAAPRLCSPRLMVVSGKSCAVAVARARVTWFLHHHARPPTTSAA